MSDNINKMDFKQLRNEVQLLRDELAIMKRKYDDIIYNLDDENFSSRLIKEKDNMKTSIEITEEGIKTKVSKTDLDKSLSNYSTIEQTADQIKASVESVNKTTDGKLEKYATLENIKALPADFKKKNGFLESIRLSKELNIYRQNYCGCEFSKR